MPNRYAWPRRWLGLCCLPVLLAGAAPVAALAHPLLPRAVAEWPLTGRMVSPIGDGLPGVTVVGHHARHHHRPRWQLYPSMSPRRPARWYSALSATRRRSASSAARRNSPSSWLRTGAPADALALLTLLAERRRELLGESLRWHDLVREGVVLDVMNAWINKEDAGNKIARNIGPNMLIYPVPQMELSAAPGLYDQNPGY